MSTSPAPTAQTWIDQGNTFTTSSGHRIFYRRRGHGPTIVMLHGFPTWSYDYAPLAEDLSADHDVVTLDFLGYGASDKPRGYEFSVSESADTVEELLQHLQVPHASLVIHDYGGIVGQELLDRRRRSLLSFTVDRVHLLNCGVVYSAYRPTRVQRLLATPLVGALLARRVSHDSVRGLIDSVRGTAKLADTDFDELWSGIALHDGHKLAHRHIRYNSERAVHHARWQSALEDYDGSLQLIWGTADPVSGQHVLDAVRPLLPAAAIVELDTVGHFPQSEDPQAVAAAIRSA